MRRGILGVACLLVLFAASAGSAQAARYDAHTVIVKLASGVSDAQRAALYSGAGVTGTAGSVRGVGADVVRVAGDPAVVAAQLNRSALVDYRGAELRPQGDGHPERPALLAALRAQQHRPDRRAPGRRHRRP